MNLDRQINVGKYEASRYIHDEESAKDYLEACVRESIHSGISVNDARKIELDNIMNFAKQHYDPKLQRQIYQLLMRVAT